MNISPSDPPIRFLILSICAVIKAFTSSYILVAYLVAIFISLPGNVLIPLTMLSNPPRPPKNSTSFLNELIIRPSNFPIAQSTALILHLSLFNQSSIFCKNSAPFNINNPNRPAIAARFLFTKSSKLFNLSFRLLIKLPMPSMTFSLKFSSKLDDEFLYLSSKYFKEPGTSTILSSPFNPSYGLSLIQSLILSLIEFF